MTQYRYVYYNGIEVPNKPEYRMENQIVAKKTPDGHYVRLSGGHIVNPPMVDVSTLKNTYPEFIKVKEKFFNDYVNFVQRKNRLTIQYLERILPESRER